jgi:predicted helicase
VATFSDLFGRLDPDPKIRGKQFEHVCKWFLTNDPTYKAQLRNVWLWKEWRDRWSETEAGIDLVAKDIDGHLWAIQAKAYAEDHPIPKREWNKFLSESNRRLFSYRLLISTNTEGLHHIAQGTVDGQEKPVLILDRSGLEASPVQWHTSPDDLRPSPPAEPAQPRDYQEDAIRDVVDGFASADRGQLLMACGTGKTLTAWFITEKLAVERTLVLVPSLSLLKQTMREWQNSAGGEVRFAPLPVCSDATVVQRDDAPVHTCDLGVPVTTNPAHIAAFCESRDTEWCSPPTSPRHRSPKRLSWAWSRRSTW